MRAFAVPSSSPPHGLRVSLRRSEQSILAAAALRVRRIGVVVACGVGLVIASAFVLGQRWLTKIPTTRAFPAPERTQWAPAGVRQVEASASPVLPEPDTFHAMHVDTRNSDEIGSVAAR